MKRSDANKLSHARVNLDTAAGELQELLLSLDTEYATQTADWQEGVPGMCHCRFSGEVRAAIEAIRNFELPDLGGLG